jgi:uncharacterized protein YoxC
MPVFDIFLIILMGAASLLCLALIFFLGKITNSITELQKNLTGLSVQITPIVNNVTDLTEKFNVVAEELKQPVNDVVGLIEQIKERVDIIFDAEEKIRHNLVAGVSGVYNGVRTFWETYKADGRTVVRKIRI